MRVTGNVSSVQYQEELQTKKTKENDVLTDATSSAEQKKEALRKKLMEEGSSESIHKKILPYNENCKYEIYAITIQEGKVCVTGGEGCEEKARAYEKLLNASFPYVMKWNFNGRTANESDVLARVSEVMDYYTEYDKLLKEKKEKDSIVNHVDDAFRSWCENHGIVDAHGLYSYTA